ncbi:hypothetical protein BGZ83_009016, partial [Gryganskiella cystojenkinii]
EPAASSSSSSSSSASASASVPTPTASSDQTTITSTPSLKHRGCMDYAESMSITELLEEIRVNNDSIAMRTDNLSDKCEKRQNRDGGEQPRRVKQEVLIGVDPGRSKMFNAVPVPVSTAIKLQNRYEALSSRDSERIDELDSDFHSALAQSRTMALNTIKIPEAHETPIRRIYERLAGQSLENASSVMEVEQAAQVRRAAAAEVRKFERSPAMRNMKHHTNLSLNRAYDYAAARERSICKNGKF